MNITVYLGASETHDIRLIKAAEELGRWIANNGHTLVYGGSKCGLMGELAQAVMQNGGAVIGVEPRAFVENEVQYDEITELIVTEGMTERKAMMVELGDVFIAFPGGTGTLEEITEVMSMTALGHLDSVCILYNIDGYYEGLKMQLEMMKSRELSSQKRLSKVFFAENIKMIEEIIV